MPKLPENRVPSYRLHRQSGQAIVTLNGKDILLGAHGTAASRAEYNRTIAEWLGNGRVLFTAPMALTITELIERYKKHVEVYYRKPDGTVTSEVGNIAQAMRPLRKMYGNLSAAEFGPLKLKALRTSMTTPARMEDSSGAVQVSKGWCRTNTNKMIGRVRQLFRWAAENGSSLVMSRYRFRTCKSTLPRCRECV
jgi:hypothetical protein